MTGNQNEIVRVSEATQKDEGMLSLKERSSRRTTIR